jgi:putative PIN family toxin of toxin-antitoxin system
MIAVYDTNVLISGIFWRGAPRQLIHLARAGQVRVVTCQALADELASVLTRPDKSFRLSSTEATAVVNDVLTYSRLVTPTREINVCRDNKDNMVLACAVAGQARYIVTGDPDLLTLKDFEEISILNPRDFLSAIQTH